MDVSTSESALLFDVLIFQKQTTRWEETEKSNFMLLMDELEQRFHMNSDLSLECYSLS